MTRSILYIAPTFLAYRLHKRIRGVQVFDLAFAPELASLADRVVVPADWSWRHRLREYFAAAPPSLKVRYTPPLFRPLWNALTLPALIHQRFDYTFLGNPARGVMPGLALLRARGLAGQIVLQANRAPRHAVARQLAKWGCIFTAVSQQVADQFPEELRDRVSVFYGVIGAGAFHPPKATRPDDGLVHFGLVGKLDNAWKGADRAVAAFADLPAEVRVKARLHLLSFGDDRTIADPCVVCHPWMPTEAVPEFLRSLDVMLVPSFGPQETFSQSIVQGMLTELPIIASDLPVLTEKLTAGGGIIAGDHAALVNAVTDLVRDPARRKSLGQEARRTALSRYIWDSAEFVRRFMN